MRIYDLYVNIKNDSSKTINDIHIENYFPKGIPVNDLGFIVNEGFDFSFRGIPVNEVKPNMVNSIKK